ncbi:MAG: DUF4116 domain-containing protein [Chlamydiales bacterium]
MTIRENNSFYKHRYEHRLTDRIPIVSTFIHGAKLFKKYGYRHSLKKENLDDTHIYTQLDAKEAKRSVMLLFPFVGNMIVAIFDFKEYLMKKSIIDDLKQESEEKLSQASLSLRQDPKFMLEVAKTNLKGLVYADSNLKNDSAFVLELLKKCGIISLSHLNFYLEVKISNLNLIYRRSAHELFHEFSDLQKNSDFMLEALKLVGRDVLMYAHPSLLEDPQFMLRAVTIHPSALAYADSSLANDADFMIKVGKINLDGLGYIDSHLKKDKNFMLRAAQEINIEALTYADSSLANDADFMIKVGKINLDGLDYAASHLKQDADFMLKTGKEIGIETLAYADIDLKNDPEFMLTSIKELGVGVLAYANLELKNDLDFMLDAIDNIGIEVIPYLGSLLKEDSDFMLDAIDLNPLALLYFRDVDDSEFQYRLLHELIPHSAFQAKLNQSIADNPDVAKQLENYLN